MGIEMRTEHLNRRHLVTDAQSFSQHWFRRKYGLAPSMGLCAGLLQAWWTSVRKGDDGIALLRNAPIDLVKEIVQRQFHSYYFARTPSDADLDEETVYWLTTKYGNADLHALQTLCHQYGCRELLELDLALDHGAYILDRLSLSTFSSELLDAFIIPADPGLRMLLLRYAHTGSRGGQCGHRLGMVVTPHGTAKFFDPNYGELTFTTLQQFRDWFGDFWEISEYKSGVEHPVAEIPPFRFYRLGFEKPPASSFES
jgi:hypothetical protein